MFGTIKVGDKEVQMLSNGATPYRFKQVFKKDLLKFFSDAVNGKSEDGEAADMAIKLGFLMAMQAKKVNLNTLSEEDFITWLEDFEANDMILASENILALYNGNASQDSESKKEDDRPTGS